MKTDVLLDRAPKASDSKIIVVSEQDVEPTIERNKVLRSIPQKSDWGRHIATIDNVILVTWLNEEWARGNTSIKLFDAEFNRLVARKLGDPSWKNLRTDK